MVAVPPPGGAVMAGPRHEAALAALSAALDARTSEAWQEARDVLDGLLDDGERFALAWAIRAGAGLPSVPLDKEDAQRMAQGWAADAMPEELRAYAWSIWKAMPPGMQSAFFAAITKHRNRKEAA